MVNLLATTVPFFAGKPSASKEGCIYIVLNLVTVFFFRLRRFIHWIVTKKVFDMFIMLIIILSSIALASEDPVDEDSPRYAHYIKF